MFWAHGNSYLSRLQEIPKNLHTRGNFVDGENAQDILEPIILQFVDVVKDHASKQESIRWLTLIRASLTKGTLGAFMQGKGFLDLSPNDRLGVLGILELCALEYGKRDDYISRFGCFEDLSHKHPLDAINSLPTIPESDIKQLKDFLELAVGLYVHEKVFRNAGRGSPFALSPDGTFVCPILHAIHDGYVLYDNRVRTEQEKGFTFSPAGFPGSIHTRDFANDLLFAMAPIPLDQYSKYMTDLHARLGLDFNPHNYAPALIDATEAFETLRRMPRAVGRLTGGLSPEELVASFRTFSRIGIGAFQNPATRYWLGNYGFAPITQDEFNAQFDRIIIEIYPPNDQLAPQKIRSRFVDSFGPRLNQSITGYQSIPVLQYMSTRTQLRKLDATGALLLDFLRYPEDIKSWLMSPVLSGDCPDETRGGRFEEWLLRQLLELKATIPGLFSADGRKRLKVKIKPGNELHTDIDVAFSVPPNLFLLSCKSRPVDSATLMGVAKNVRNRWNTVLIDLLDWDKKMSALFSTKNWRSINPELAELAKGCQFGISALITPRVEWIPSLSRNLVLHPGWPGLTGIEGYPVPRIGAFDDLRRLFTYGIPLDFPVASWKIPLN